MSDVALDATAQAATRRLLDRHPADRPRTRADLDGLPGPVALRAHAALDARVAAAAAPPQTPWVDAEDPALCAAVEAWAAAANGAACVPAGAWAEFLSDAVRGALDHLVRPARALAADAFRGEAEPGGDLPTALAVGRARSAGSFPYLADIAAQYAARKGAERIDQAGLERLFGQIDRRVAALFRADEWAALLAPLFEVAGGAVPGPVLRDALAARGADALAARFESSDEVTPDAFREGVDEALPPVAETDTIGETATAEPAAPPPDESAPDELPDPAESEPVDEGGEDEDQAPNAGTTAPPVIGSKWQSVEETYEDDSSVLGAPRPAPPPDVEDDVLTTEEEPEAPPPPASEMNALVAEEDVSMEPGSDPEPFVFPLAESEAGGAADDVLADPETAGPEPEDSGPDVSDAGAPDDEPLWRRIARQQGVEIVESAPREAPAESGAAPLWQRFTEPADALAHPAPPGPDGVERRVLGETAADLRAWFVAELFGGDAEDYRRTLAALDGARTWTDATQIIARDVFQRHRVNIYSDPAVAFTDAVEANVRAR